MIADPKVLIVEDETVVQLHLQTIVQELGYVISGMATTATEALASAAANTPDLVLMDIRLQGGLDGVEVARELRNRYDVAVLFLTAYADEETVARTQEIGAVGYIVKPFSIPQIRAALSTALTKHREVQRVREDMNSLASTLGRVGDAVIVTDRKSAIVFMNPQASAITGWSQEEALNKCFMDVVRVPGQTRAGTSDGLPTNPFSGNTAPLITDLEIVARDGTKRCIEMEVKPLAHTDGTKGPEVIVLREVSSGRQEVNAPSRPNPRRFGAETRMAIYSHDTFGLGHLNRCLNISRTLVDRFPGLSVLLVTGSPMVHRYPLPKGLDYVKLPAVRKVGAEEYRSRSLGLSYEDMLRLRTNLVLRSIQDYDPHALLVDHAPVGMKGEILPALEWLHRDRPSCVKMIGLRDILDDPDTVIELWGREGIYDILREFYDYILVYGSQEVFDPVAAYRFPAKLKSKTFYCNYIREAQPNGEAQEEQLVKPGEKPLIVVTIGGGDGYGEVVIGSYIKMLRRFVSEVRFESLILTGPFLDPDLLARFREEIQGLPGRLLNFVSSTSPYLARADLIVSTGGYNTIAQTLCYGKKALVIPRLTHRKEQLIRAERFAGMGLISLLRPEDVTPERLYESIKTLLANPSQPLLEARSSALIRFDGAERVADFCSRLRFDRSPTKRTPDD
jgi:PAS domain S-box-containing protein